MTAYSRLQEREFENERLAGYRAVKHQSFVGTGYFDQVAADRSPAAPPPPPPSPGRPRRSSSRPEGELEREGGTPWRTSGSKGRDRPPRNACSRRRRWSSWPSSSAGSARHARTCCGSGPGARRISPTACSSDFLEHTRSIRETAWEVAPAPPDLQDRRVEITGPVERKMMINALNSGASVFMADFEDSLSPTWENVVAGPGEPDRRRAARASPSPAPRARSTGSTTSTATLVVRPRGWHLAERHVLVDGRAGLRQPLRLRPLLLPQRRGAAPPRHRPLLLPAEAGEPRRGGALERGLRRSPRTLLRISARHHPRHRADRDHHRRLRDGRDPLGAARPRRRPQRRPLGLHLQHHPQAPRSGTACCPTAPR